MLQHFRLANRPKKDDGQWFDADDDKSDVSS
jgi:hypothetical protein